MTGTDTKPAAAVEAYFADPGRVGASGGETGNRSSHGPLANPLDAVGASLEPQVFRVGELAGRGAGDARPGLHAAKRPRKDRPRDGRLARLRPRSRC